MNHMMVDLETLDTRPTTVILSIGACVFDESGFRQGADARFYQRVGWQAQIDSGRTVSESTIKWWMMQSDAARQALIGESVSLQVALMGLSATYRATGCERIWANGTTFDISILEHAYAGAQPWKYNAMRDMRGLRDLVPDDLMADTPNLAAHDALADAVWQAEFVVRALKHLKK
jgi:hypothetical protein